MQVSCSLSSAGKPRPPPSAGSHHYVSPAGHAQSDSGMSGAEDIASTNGSRASQGARHDLLGLDPSWKQEMVSHYFNVVHDKHHSLFHRPTFERNLQENRIADVILFSVLSLGSRYYSPAPYASTMFLTGPIRFSSTPQRHGDHLADRAYQALDMRDTSVATIQACILLGTLCFVDGKTEAEALYYATALRLGLILNLPQKQCATELERQIHLRGKFLVLLDECRMLTLAAFQSGGHST